MSPYSGLSSHRYDIQFGSFSWPIDSSDEGYSSRVVARLVGAAVTNSEGFKAQLGPEESVRYDQSLLRPSGFRIDLTLRNGREITMTAAVDETLGAKRVHGTLEDSAQSRAERADLMAREELCRAVAENSPAMLWMGDENGKCVFLNQSQRDFWGIDPEDLSTFDWTSTTHKDDIETLSGPFIKAMTEQIPFSVAARYRAADGQYRTLRTRANPRFDRAGKFLGMTGVNNDITDQLAAEAQSRLLMGELNHRTKNIISVVQAVARQTAKNSAPGEFDRIFNNRLVGLAASNDLLLRSDWSGVEMADLVEVQLQHLEGLIGERIKVKGPHLLITSMAAQTLGMALHELSTNSLKYGALSATSGSVEISWDVDSGGETDGFSLRWFETGLPNVSSPNHKGFGHVVIVDMIVAAFNAEVDLRFEPDGLKWQVTAHTNCKVI